MAYKTSPLRHLGNISGLGVVRRQGEEIARVRYDFDGYYRERMGVTCSGEIEAPAEVLQRLLEQADLQILTDRGLLLDFTFSDTTLPAGSDAAHVEVTGNLSLAPGDWGH